MPLVIVPILLLTLGIGFIISILNAIVRDTGHLLSIVMTLLMYVTPVLYAKPEFGIISLITKYNPMYYMISERRDLFLQGIINDMQGFIWSVVGSCILFVSFPRHISPDGNKNHRANLVWIMISP